MHREGSVIGLYHVRYCGFDTSISDLTRQKRGPKYDHEEQEQAGEDFKRDVVNVLQSLLALHVGVVYVPVLRTCVDCSSAGRLADILERIDRKGGRRRRRRRRVFGR